MVKASMAPFPLPQPCATHYRSAPPLRKILDPAVLQVCCSYRYISIQAGGLWGLKAPGPFINIFNKFCSYGVTPKCFNNWASLICTPPTPSLLTSLSCMRPCLSTLPPPPPPPPLFKILDPALGYCHVQRPPWKIKKLSGFLVLICLCMQ